MDQLDSKNGSNNNKLEAIHLLPKIDVKSIKKYVDELLRRYHIKKSEYTSECLVCSCSLLKNWKSLVQHLRSPSHLNSIKTDSKQFTAICILCKYILIADDADFIFEHFILHKAVTGQIDKQVVHMSFEKDTVSHSSIISSSTSKDNKNIHTNSKKQKCAPHMEKKCLNNEEGKFRSSEGVAIERYESVLNDSYVNADVEHSDSSNSKKKNLASSISPLSHNQKEKLSTTISSNVKTCTSVPKSIPTIFKQEVGEKLLKENQNYPNSICQKKNTKAVNIDNNYGINRRSKLAINFIKPSNNTMASSISVVSPLQNDVGNIVSDKVSSQSFVPESSKKCFYPKLAFFSNTTLQLICPGVSKGEFTVNQELNAVNICDYLTKTYYSFYYRLQKLYFSCLECKTLRLQENDFYKHLAGVKHHNNLGDSYNVGFIKICDVCQILLLGHIDLIKEHFQCNAHKQNIKCKMDLIEQQYAVINGKQKLGYSGELTDKCSSFFSSKEVLNSRVECSLKKAKEVASMAGSLSRILETDIKKTLKEKYNNFHVKIVGSRLYGLANHQSDVDIHLNIGDVSVGDLEKYFHKAVHLFEVKRTILDAKVPIILKHLKSSLICDVDSTNPAGPYCSELIKCN